MFQSKWCLLPILLVAFLLWASRVGGSLQGSEVEVWGTVEAEGTRVVLAQELLQLRKPPPVVFTEWLGARIGRDSPVLWRLPSLCLALLSIGLTYALGRRLLNARAAWIGALLLALSPLQISYASQAGSALVAMTLALATCWSFYRAGDSGGRWGALLLYATCASSLALSHRYGLLLVLALSLLARISKPTGERRLHLAGLLAVGVLLGYLHWILGGHGLSLSERDLGSLGVGNWDWIFLEWMANARSFHPVLSSSGGLLEQLRPWLLSLLPWVLMLLLVRSCMTLIRSQRIGQELDAARVPGFPASAHLLPLCLILPTGLWIASRFGGPAAVAPTDLLPALPFFLLILATGLSSGLGNRLPWALGLGLFLKLDLLYFMLQPGVWSAEEPRADWAAAASYLGQELERGTTAREVYVAYDQGLVLGHYDARLQVKSWRQRLQGLYTSVPSEPLAARAFFGGAEGLASLDGLELAWENAWEARAMGVLGIEDDPLREHGPSRAEGLPFYLIFKQHPGQDAYRLHPLLLPPILGDIAFEQGPLGDPTLDVPLGSSALLEVLEERRLDSLVIFKLDWIQ